MARYVLLEIEDNAAAEKFVEAFNNDQVYVSVAHPKLDDQYSVVRMATLSTDPNNPDVTKKFRAVGMWMKPTIPCTCGGAGSIRGNFTRGTTYGIYVHSVCAKASAVDIEKFGSLLPFGYNLLVKEDTPDRVFGPLDIDGNVRPGTRAIEQGKIPNPRDKSYTGKRK